jgi:flagellar biosynthesis/type III secretory pathway ATPase
MSALLGHLELAERQPLIKVSGRVTSVTGLTVEAVGLRVQVGAMCRTPRTWAFAAIEPC